MSDLEETRKSSNEILTELFGVFNAKPPSLHSEVSQKKHKKKAKSKKLKKKKSKKHKKKRSSSSSDDSSDSEDEPKSKRVKVVSADALPLALDMLLDNLKESIDSIVKEEKRGEDIKNTPGNSTTSTSQVPSVQVKEEPRIKTESIQNKPSIVEGDCKGKIKEEKSDNDVFHPLRANDEGLSDAFGGADEESNEITSTSKKKAVPISMPNLVNSAVFHEAVKAVEEQKQQEKERKAKFEDGELTESSHESDVDLGGNGLTSHPHKKHKRSHSSKELHRSQRKDRSRSRHRSRSRDRDRSRRKSREPLGRLSYYGNRLSSARDRYRNPHHRMYGQERHFRVSRERERRLGSRRSTSRDRKRARSRSKEKEERRRSKSKDKSKESDDDDSKIDKEKLLAIARKNAKKLVKAGVVSVDNLNSITRIGRTVTELTEYCKKLSKKDALGEDVSDIDSNSSDDGDLSFHHPFQVRDRPSSIVMNIKNAISLPVRSFQEQAAEQSKLLRLTYPVSSGSTHRATENEWIPVEPEPSKPQKPKTSLKSKPPEALMPPPPPPPPPQPPPKIALSAVPPPTTPAPVFPVIQPAIKETEAEPIPDISSIVSKRLDALRALQENPQNRTAKVQVQRTERLLEKWVKTVKTPQKGPEIGVFTGSTGARVLTPQQLSSGPQAWAKRDQLLSAQPVSGGMGMALLQKMGWQPGEGLGKHKEGSLEPLKLEIKTDKKGLVAFDETSWGSKTPNHVGPTLPTVKTLDGKHPVSLLNEYCVRKKWGLPQYELAAESGPPHKKSFLFKVIVNGKEYTPSVPSLNKKQSKAESAAIALRALGLIANPSPAT